MKTHAINETGEPVGHEVQFFDATDSLVRAVAAFLSDGLDRGDTLLVAATGAHWRLIKERLTGQGHDVTSALASHRLTVLDAADTLAQFMRQTLPDRVLFDDAVGSLVERLSAAPNPRLRIYGEMVNLLVEEGNFAGAQRLEELWNGLAARCNFLLFCGYTSTHFGDPHHGDALRAICETHTSVHAHPTDELAAFLVHHHFAGQSQPQDLSSGVGKYRA